MAKEIIPAGPAHFDVQPADEVTDLRYSRSRVTGLRTLTVIGLLIAGLFFGALISWISLAELSSAAIAPGVVKVASNLKTIQHLERGIVKELLVQDGDEVAANQVLLRLDGTETQSKLKLLQHQKYSALALIARLSAERDGLGAVQLPERLDSLWEGAERDELFRVQQDIFDARRNSVATKKRIVAQRIGQYEKEIEGLEAQVSADDERLELIGKELADMERLFERKLVPVTRVLELQRNVAKIRGERGSNLAEIARVGQRISEARLEIIELDESRREEAVLQLREARQQLSEAQEKIPALEDASRRLDVRAPIDGTVVNLQVHTIGGVIGPGEPIMEIVPKNDTLVIEAKINPIDIDVIHPGLLANVTLTALNRRSNAPLQARVLWVSADLLSEPQSGQSYFLARLELTDELQSSQPEMPLTPGMLAEVTILTGQNTYLEYLIEPLERNLSRAFRDG
ncbi:MAG: HlyD family type I secretion periplasmic adaptor subunit [Gammaproteobacteria bacterium]|nr:HlyD family type I secretion periplasmic adaptor subunit [Gammaproteobacteria bacterium]